MLGFIGRILPASLLLVAAETPATVVDALSEKDVMDVREQLIRGVFEALGELQTQPPRGERPFCVAIASERDLEGTDPPATLLGRLRDVPQVRPLSWCRSHQQGDVLALGPVTSRSTRSPLEDAITWHVMYAWNGEAWSATERFVRSGGMWQLDANATSHSDAPKPAPSDPSSDRQRIAAALVPFVEAWNRGDSLLPWIADRGSDEDLASGRRQQTRLDPSPVSIEFEHPDVLGSYARVRLGLNGTFQPRPGTLWPIDPWKQAGARTFVELTLKRVDGWWRVGNWHIEWFETPWSVVRLYH